MEKTLEEAIAAFKGATSRPQASIESAGGRGIAGGTDGSARCITAVSRFIRTSPRDALDRKAAEQDTRTPRTTSAYVILRHRGGTGFRGVVGLVQGSAEQDRPRQTTRHMYNKGRKFRRHEERSVVQKGGGPGVRNRPVHLGGLYYNALGVPQTFVEAGKW
jgi:hypothetical protein